MDPPHTHSHFTQQEKLKKELATSQNASVATLHDPSSAPATPVMSRAGSMLRSSSHTGLAQPLQPQPSQTLPSSGAHEVVTPLTPRGDMFAPPVPSVPPARSRMPGPTVMSEEALDSLFYAREGSSAALDDASSFYSPGFSQAETSASVWDISALEKLTQLLSSREPEDIRAVLTALSDGCGVGGTGPKCTQSSEDQTAGVILAPLRATCKRALGSLWMSINVLRWGRAGSGRETKGLRQMVHDSAIVTVLCKVRFHITDYIIGVALRVRERLKTHFIFWRWVEARPYLCATEDAALMVDIILRVEQALDAAMGIVHLSSAEISKLLSDSSADNAADNCMKLKAAMATVSELNVCLFKCLLDNSIRLLDTMSLTAPSLVDPRCLRQLAVVRRVGAAGMSAASPAEIIALMSAELDLLSVDFADQLCAAVERKRRDLLNKQYRKLAAVGAVGACGFLWLWKTGKIGRVVSSLQDAHLMLNEFLDQHVVEPIKAIYAELFISVPDVLKHDQSVDQTVAGTASLRSMLIDFIETAKPECTEALREAVNGNIHSTVAWEPVMTVLEEQIRYPLFNAARGEVGRALLLLGMKTKVTIDQQSVEVDILIRANRMNMNAFATIPAFMLVYGAAQSFFAVKSLFSQLLPVKDPALNCVFSLRDIYRLFSRLSSTGEPSESDESAYLLWLEEHGRVLAALSSLEKSAASMSLRIETKIALAEDMEELKTMYAMDSIDLSQVDRIWRTYPYLFRARKDVSN